MKLSEHFGLIKLKQADIAKEEQILNFCKGQADASGNSSPWKAKCEAEAAKINEDRQMLDGMKLKALNALEGQRNERAISFIINHYLAFKTYKEMEKEMYLSRSTLYRTRDEAIKIMEEIEV